MRERWCQGTVEKHAPNVVLGMVWQSGASRKSTSHSQETTMMNRDEIGMSTSDPHRETDDGKPYLDDANPFGRKLENREGEDIGGEGTVESPRDPAGTVDNSTEGAGSPDAFPSAIERESNADRRR
jgi:hypothetical protein